ncbi:hypothetical protein NDU88_001433 [Pleurodeles waltl]|uniref:Uncharacterized protein n=1 Tax=Pleurodeles waltl TaxID=8319 RepID=A0AAV7M874_PLEWA|nr:hypothetical protein NDU88_001433 [Pleurodeles waltl]
MSAIELGRSLPQPSALLRQKLPGAAVLRSVPLPRTDRCSRQACSQHTCGLSQVRRHHPRQAARKSKGPQGLKEASTAAGPRKPSEALSSRGTRAARAVARPSHPPGPRVYTRSRPCTLAGSGRSPSPPLATKSARGAGGQHQARPREPRPQHRTRPLPWRSDRLRGPRGGTARPALAAAVRRINKK